MCQVTFLEVGDAASRVCNVFIARVNCQGWLNTVNKPSKETHRTTHSRTSGRGCCQFLKMTNPQNRSSLRNVGTAMIFWCNRCTESGKSTFPHQLSKLQVASRHKIDNETKREDNETQAFLGLKCFSAPHHIQLILAAIAELVRVP